MSYTFPIENISLDDDRVVFVEAKPASWAGDLEVQKLFDELENHNIPTKLWPKYPSDNKCLERALHSMKSRRSLVRPLSKSKGFSLILENEDELDLEEVEREHNSHKVELTCKVKRAEDDHHVSTLHITPEDHPAVPLIRQEFRRYRGEGDREGLFKCSQDLSVWFSQTIIPWVRGVATRSRGGSYYVMKGEYLDRLRRVASALDEASTLSQETVVVSGKNVSLTRVHNGGHILLKPEVGSTSAVEILVDNVISECDRTCDQLSQKLREGGLGKKALSTQKTVAKDTEHKLKEYEQLLDTNLDVIKNRVQSVTSAIGMAELQLLEDKNE